MLKKIFAYLFAVLIMATSVYSLVLMYNSDNKYYPQLDPGNSRPVAPDLTDTWRVGRTNVIVKLIADAIVAPSSQEVLRTYHIVGNKDSIVLNINVGDTIDKNFVFAQKADEEYEAPSRMKCLSIAQENDVANIVFLDFSQLYIEARIPSYAAGYELFSLPFSFVNDVSVFSGYMSYLDFKVESEYIISRYAYDNEDVLLLPGTKLTLEAVLGRKDDVIAIPLAFVEVRGNQYFAHVLDIDNSVEYIAIKIGMIGTNNVEVLSGLSENSTLLCPSEEQSLLHLLLQQGGSNGKN